jgi:hypothetical protein
VSDAPFIGRPALTARGYDCCGKPQGCTNQNPRCAYLQHPFKRFVRGEITLDELNAKTAR